MAAPKPNLEADELVKALRLLGGRVGGYDVVELLIVGGMAGKLAGLLPPERVTIDCDVMVYEPEASFGQIELEAFRLGKEMGLPRGWLNGDSKGFASKLPDGWKERRRHLGDFGLLRVYYVDRLDFIALKVLAGRDVDQKDLKTVKVTPAEAGWVLAHLARLKRDRVVDAGKCEEAAMILRELEEQP